MPMMTPSATPAKPKNKLIGCSETEKPSARLEINSMERSLLGTRIDGLVDPHGVLLRRGRSLRCIQNTSLPRESTRADPRRPSPAAPLSPHGKVVDQPRLANTRGDQQPDGAVLQRADRREGLGMARLEGVR